MGFFLRDSQCLLCRKLIEIDIVYRNIFLSESPRRKPMDVSRTSVCVTALAMLATVCAASAQTKLYFTEYQFNNPQIKVMNLDGSNVQSAATLQPSQWLPIGLAIDSTNNQIYWTLSNFGSGGIYRTPIGSASSTPLVTGQTFPFGVSLDLAGEKMYWGDSSENTVKRANLNGSNIETLYGDAQTWKPVVDPVNGYVYFGAGGAIRRVSLDGIGGVQTVVSGVSSVFAVALDVANNHIYWVDQQTTADHIARANLDDTGWTVLIDLSPDQFGSSALNDIRLDLNAGKMYFCDDLRTMIWSADLDGDNFTPIYTSPEGLAPSGLSFDVEPSQPMMDCNQNSVRDKDDITGGFSADCNTNGIPDECENDPCALPMYLLNHDVNTVATRRALGDSSPGVGWQIYQPFDVPKSGWNIGTISIHGYTTNYNAAGFTATIFPDNGAGSFPNEAQPLGSANLLFRVGAIWLTQPLELTLPAGRHWVRLTANASYEAGVNVGASGLPSISKSNSGTLFPNSPPIALRFISAEEVLCPSDIAPPGGNGTVDVDDLLLVINSWGPCDGECAADIAPSVGNGVVDVDDLLTVINNWGDCAQ
jgi:hypothetical protein